MKRGSIYWVNLEPTTPPEVGKLRPALIVSNSEQNSILGSVVVVPLSSKPGEIWPLRLEIQISARKKSFAVIPGIRQVSKSRLNKLIGILTAAQMKCITEAIHTYLGNY